MTAAARYRAAFVALAAAVGSIPMLAPFVGPWLSRAGKEDR